MMHFGRRAALGGAKVELESRVDFGRFVDQEIVRWNAIARAGNIQLE